MIGGIEYHEKKAVMKDIHAYVFAKIIRIFILVRIKLNVPNAALSCEVFVESADESLWPCHAGRRLSPLKRTASYRTQATQRAR